MGKLYYGNTLLIDGDNSGGNLKNHLFDVVEKDHELTDAESTGYAKLGTYVYKNAFGTAQGYPDFVDQAFAEYNASLTNAKYGYKSSNVALTGDTSDTNGILSGFYTNTSYGQFPAKTPTTSFELVIKHKNPLLGTTLSPLESTASTKGIIIRNVNASTGQMNIWVGTGSAWTIQNVNTNCPMTADTWIWHKIAWDGTNLTVASSTDGIDYTTGLTQALALAPDWDTSGYQGLGGYSWESYAYFNGIIDLNECYLNIDGQRYWTGVNKYRVYENDSGRLFYDIADKADIDTVYNTTHSAWFYGIDKINNRVFLPRRTERKLVKSQKPTGALKQWYNLYSDGWCEQGASISGIDANYRGRKINFLIPYNNNGYSISIENGYTAQTDSATNISEKTETYFGCSVYNSTGNALWSAAGYTDFISPDYRYMIVGSNESQTQTTEALDITSSENDTIPLSYCTYQNSEAQVNPAWLKSDDMWHTKTLYPGFYSYLVANIGTNNIVDSTSTITDPTNKFIVNQTNEAFKLPIRTDERRLVYTYSNGTEWVNWYSDGWLEQGGTISIPNTQTVTQVDLVKNYKNTDYIVSYTANPTSLNWTNMANAQVTNKTISSFGISDNVGNTNNCNWRTCGYSTIPQYSDYNTMDALFVKVSNAVQNLQLLDVGVLMNYLKTFEVVDNLPESQLSNVFYFCRNYQD